ncbi:PIN domain-containing protein [Glycomyces albus]
MTESSNELVIDASALVAVLADADGLGEWAAGVIAGKVLFAPELLRYETANILRRHRLAGLIDETSASSAHCDLLDLAIHFEPYPLIADRVWELRDNVTVYDAAYVALAEARGAPLATADIKLARSSGPRCRFLTPPAA